MLEEGSTGTNQREMTAGICFVVLFFSSIVLLNICYDPKEMDLMEFYGEGVQVEQVKDDGSSLPNPRKVAVVRSISHPEKRVVVLLREEQAVKVKEGDSFFLHLDELGKYRLDSWRAK